MDMVCKPERIGSNRRRNVEPMTRPQKRLDTLLAGLGASWLRGGPEVVVNGVQADSRQIVPGDLFVAITGHETDGHRFLDAAAERGAVAAVVSREVDVPGLRAVARVESTRAALPWIAAAFWNQPTLSFDLVGITGTNGKTTLTYLLESVVRAAGLAPGVIGTVNARFGGNSLRLAHTTPEAHVLQELFDGMRREGVSHALLEASSHALDLERVRGCHFRAGVFTNLSRDHLDYHRDMEGYARAKSLLFSRELPASRARDKVVVANRDDPRWREVVGGWDGRLVTFGTGSRADVGVTGTIRESLEGFRTRVRVPGGELDLDCSLAGRHNLSNALAAVAVAWALGFEAGPIQNGIASCRTVPGRLERVGSSDAPFVFVDYAHTDQALSHVLAALRPLTPGRLLVVFGCGGDRDRGKRALMGAAVARGADLAVVTNDNPRTEDPAAIVDAILPGLEKTGFARVAPRALSVQKPRRFTVIPDRREAIRLAVRVAGAGDAVLVAGKGHEDHQILGTRRVHFDDREEAARALAEQQGEVRP